MSIESLLAENAKLRKRVVEMDRHNVYLANTVGPMSKENAELKRIIIVANDHSFLLAGRVMKAESAQEDLEREIIILREQKAQLWKELVDMGCADFPTVDEHFKSVALKISAKRNSAT